MEENIEVNYEESRYARLELIPWWNQDKLLKARIMVVGAGAIGNEIIKNLALLGIGYIFIVDIDKIENTNLTRSVLFRQADLGRYKSEVAAERAMEMNPDVKAIALTENIIFEIGLGLFREMDLILGGLDNREARYAVNQACYLLNKPWVDGAIEALNGFVRVFAPPGPCYECTMSEMDWKLLNKRRSCALLTHEEIAEGKIPTTSTSSSIIAGIEVQEMLKLLHDDRGLQTLAGKGYVFNGLTHDSYVVEYQRKDTCMCHDPCERIEEKPWSSRYTTVYQVLEQAKSDLGENAVLEFDKDILVQANCSCGNQRNFYRIASTVSHADILCNQCGKEMQLEITHTVCGNELFLDKTLHEIGVPLFHIIAARNSSEYIYYELSDDRREMLGGLCE